LPDPDGIGGTALDVPHRVGLIVTARERPRGGEKEPE
jgi:hypothetical protein